MASEPRTPRRARGKRAPAPSERKNQVEQHGVLTIPHNKQKKVPRLRIRLRECVELYEQRTGDRLSYPELARKSGLRLNTIKKISNTRRHYNATLNIIEGLCAALQVTLAELLEWRR